MPRSAPGWFAFWTGAGLLFRHADLHGYPLCATVRWVFGTKTRAGRVRLGASLATGGVVLYRHLVNGPQ